MSAQEPGIFLSVRCAGPRPFSEWFIARDRFYPAEAAVEYYLGDGKWSIPQAEAGTIPAGTKIYPDQVAASAEAAKMIEWPR